MRKSLTLALLLAFALSSTFLAGCSDDDEAGADFGATNKLGSITATFSGTDMNGTSFTQVAEYKFTDPAVTPPQASRWIDVVREGVPERHFDIYRRTDYSYGSDGAGMIFTERNGELSFVRLSIGTTIIGKDRTFFTPNFYGPTDAAVLEPVLSDYVFNPTTGQLKFKYSFRFDKGATGNPTGNDIKITLDVDVLLYKQID